jgi:para-aminobenzoate synthetase component 1
MFQQEAISVMNGMGKNNDPFVFIIDFSMDDCIVLPTHEAEGKGILFNFNGYKNYNGSVSQKQPSVSNVNPVGYDRYRKAFDYVQKELNLGHSYLVNLTFPTNIDLNVSLKEVFNYSSAPFKMLYKDDFVVFSPERFVRISNGKIQTHPMKGTISADVENARETILNDKKERAEHATIVDLLRNDISIYASQVRVNRYRYVEQIKSNNRNLLQVSSEITGVLPDNYNELLGDIIFSLLPAGSVTGAPKLKTLEIIRNAENYNRGFYTGIAGYYDGITLESCVLIRFIEKSGCHYLYKSGGGITAESNAENEYQELIDKIYVPSD